MKKGAKFQNFMIQAYSQVEVTALVSLMELKIFKMLHCVEAEESWEALMVCCACFIQRVPHLSWQIA